MGTREDDGLYNSFKKHKRYREELEEKNRRPINMSIEQKYFNCLSCGKVNIIEDITKEPSENRTLRASYLTWKKFKDISSEKGGTLQNGLNYLIGLHEHKSSDNSHWDNEYEIGIAGFGGQDDNKIRKKR